MAYLSYPQLARNHYKIRNSDRKVHSNKLQWLALKYSFYRCFIISRSFPISAKRMLKVKLFSTGKIKCDISVNISMTMCPSVFI